MGLVKRTQQLLLDQFNLMDVGLVRFDGQDPFHRYFVRTDVRDVLEKAGRKDIGRFWNRVRDFPEAKHPDACVWMEFDEHMILVGIGYMTDHEEPGSEETGYAATASTAVGSGDSGGLRHLRLGGENDPGSGGAVPEDDHGTAPGD